MAPQYVTSLLSGCV